MVTIRVDSTGAALDLFPTVPNEPLAGSKASQGSPRASDPVASITPQIIYAPSSRAGVSPVRSRPRRGVAPRRGAAELPRGRTAQVRVLYMELNTQTRFVHGGRQLRKVQRALGCEQSLSTTAGVWETPAYPPRKTPRDTLAKDKNDGKWEQWLIFEF